MDSSGHRPSSDAIAIRPVRLSDPKMLRRLAIMIVIVGAVLGALYFFKTMRDTAIKNIFSQKPPPTAVAMAHAEMQTVPRFLTGIGTIAAVHQVTVAAQLSGMVTQILFAPGQTVTTGDPLVQLDDGPEQGDLRNFEAQARYAAVTLRRNQELLAKQAAAQSVVDQNRSQLDQADASIAKTKALIAQKLIRAPFSGKLGVRQVEVGQYVGAGTAMVTLTDLSQLYVNFTLPEQDAAALAVDQEVSFTVDAYPGQTFSAKINAIEPQVSADTRAIKLQATTANSDDKLLPGMFANAQVVLAPRTGVVTVPETAVENTLYGDSVYVIEQDGTDAAGKPVLKAKRVPVQTGEHVNGRIAIVDGLKPGDAVVALGQNKVLFDGAAVAPNEQGGLALPATLPNH
jgi:membrane fusion protein, multidrug efflux system